MNQDAKLALSGAHATGKRTTPHREQAGAPWLACSAQPRLLSDCVLRQVLTPELCHLRGSMDRGHRQGARRFHLVRVLHQVGEALRAHWRGRSLALPRARGIDRAALEASGQPWDNGIARWLTMTTKTPHRSIRGAAIAYALWLGSLSPSGATAATGTLSEDCRGVLDVDHVTGKFEAVRREAPNVRFLVAPAGVDQRVAVAKHGSGIPVLHCDELGTALTWLREPSNDAPRQTHAANRTSITASFPSCSCHGPGSHGRRIRVPRPSPETGEGACSNSPKRPVGLTFRRQPAQSTLVPSPITLTQPRSPTRPWRILPLQTPRTMPTPATATSATVKMRLYRALISRRTESAESGWSPPSSTAHGHRASRGTSCGSSPRAQSAPA